MRHKHYDCIVAWAEGKHIQWKQYGKWVDWDSPSSPVWFEANEYRIKPELEVRYLCMDTGYRGREEKFPRDNLKLTWDGDKLVGAELL